MELEEIINKLENQLKEEKNKNYNLMEKNNTLDTKIKELQSKINQQNNLLFSFRYDLKMFLISFNKLESG